jgi:hypothetical protein
MIIRRSFPKLALIAGVVSTLPLWAQEQGSLCAFEVTVKSPAGVPVVGIEVSEFETGGRVYSSGTTNRQGVARICDAPQGLIDLHIGGQLCGAVTVGYLSAYWMVTRKIDMIYKNCQGDDFLPPGGCQLTIRVRDQTGSPLAGVVINDPKERPMKRAQTTVSDEFGRIFRFLDYGDNVNVQLQREGYLSQTLTFACRTGHSFILDRAVTLEKKP